MELADVADSKSADSDIVRVQVPLPAPDSHDGFDIKTIVLFYCSKSKRYLVWNFIQYILRAYRGTLFCNSNGVPLLFRSVSIFLCAFLPYIFSGGFQDGFWEKFSFDRKLYCLTESSAFEVGFMGCFLFRLIFQIQLFHQAKISSYECGKLSEKKMLKTCPENDFVL